ncbi:PD-(D/E)XK nuclease family protein, partial [uncultured Duncaniella sp.]|uniref:RecB family exonuclease n=1 Tax=uncultured Duncaniella sp. TaxID=2768039 RepID=UPI0026EF5BC0
LLFQESFLLRSRIKAFTDCPYRWYLKYIRHPGQHGKPMFFSDYGSFVHELIAAYYSGEKTAEQVHMEYLTGFNDHVLGRAPNSKVFANYFVSGSQYLKSIRPSENEVIAVEQKVETSVTGTPFVGYIDRIDRDKDGALLVIDNKSRTLKPRSGRTKPTKADEELDH